MATVEFATQKSAPRVGKSLLLWSARGLLTFVFLYAALMKLRDPAAFHEDVLHFQWLGDPSAAWVALALPVLEGVCAIAILLPAWSRTAGIILAVLLMGFIVALVRAWAMGIDLHCGCFGPSSPIVHYPTKLAQNTVLLLVAAGLARASGER